MTNATEKANRMVDYTEIKWRLNGIVDDLENGYILTECPDCGIAPSSEGCMCNDVAAHRMTARAYLKSLNATYKLDDASGGVIVTLDDGDGYTFELDTRRREVVYRVDPYHIVSDSYQNDAMNIALEARKELEKQSD